MYPSAGESGAVRDAGCGQTTQAPPPSCQYLSAVRRLPATHASRNLGFSHLPASAEVTATPTGIWSQ